MFIMSIIGAAILAAACYTIAKAAAKPIEELPAIESYYRASSRITRTAIAARRGMAAAIGLADEALIAVRNWSSSCLSAASDEYHQAASQFRRDLADRQAASNAPTPAAATLSHSTAGRLNAISCTTSVGTGCGDRAATPSFAARVTSHVTV